jgi:hypothetical protein
VNVLYGSADGLAAARDQFWSQDPATVEGAAESGDALGASVAVGDVDDDGFDDLATGANGEDIGSRVDAGSVNVLFGSADGLGDEGDELWRQGGDGVGGAAENGDLLGSSLAAGDFDGDLMGDIAAGAPSEDIGSTTNAGAANVLYGSGSGLTGTDDQVWHQDSPDIAGNAEEGDAFANAAG